MKVLVTGGSGFLGSHIVDTLTQAGHQVTVLDGRPSPYLAENQEMLVGDILDRDFLAKAVQGKDVVYHLAALADINTALNEPRRAVSVNIMGTLEVLEACRQADVPRLIYSSTIYVYSNQGSFYRTSKQAAEHLIFDYAERFGLEYTILRYGSLYGPRADASNSVFRMLKQALSEGRIDYAGTGKEVREYIHVADAAAMSVQALEQQYANQILHLMGRERMTTADMLEMIQEMMGGNIGLNFGSDTNVGHYTQTPYSYVPKLGRKLTQDTHIDLGLGLLDCLQRMHRELCADDDLEG